MSSSPEVLSPIPDGWKRWNGARPEVTGSPKNTVLALPGLQKWSPADRAALFFVASQTGIPVDSLVLTLYMESRLIPSSRTRTAAGLNGLTLQARLPGFDTPDKIQAIANMSAADQLHKVVAPFLARYGNKVVGSDPGRLYMRNYLPLFADSSEDTVIARKNDATPIQGSLTYGSNYAANPFDSTNKGYFTVGDVFERVMSNAREANGRRMTVDGNTIEPEIVSFDADHAASGPPKKHEASHGSPHSSSHKATTHSSAHKTSTHTPTHSPSHGTKPTPSKPTTTASAAQAAAAKAAAARKQQEQAIQQAAQKAAQQALAQQQQGQGQGQGQGQDGGGQGGGQSGGGS